MYFPLQKILAAHKGQSTQLPAGFRPWARSAQFLPHSGREVMGEPQSSSASVSIKQGSHFGLLQGFDEIMLTENSAQ